MWLLCLTFMGKWGTGESGTEPGFCHSTPLGMGAQVDVAGHAAAAKRRRAVVGELGAQRAEIVYPFLSTLETFAMANDPDFIKFVLDQIDDSCEITYRNMFGGGTLYSKAKVVALICDDQLFVKPTKAGRSFIGAVVEAPAFPNAKMSFLIQDKINDSEWLTRLHYCPVNDSRTGGN